MTKINKFLLCTFVLFCAVSTANARRIYVKYGATGANNGNSWTDAYTNLWTTINAAVSGDELWVAAGDYSPTTASGTPAGLSFSLKSGVTIYGGFAGTETLLSQRDFVANETVLNGIYNPQNQIYTVVSANTVSSTAKLDGFKITGGSTGAFKITSASPTISNCVISGNGMSNTANNIIIVSGTNSNPKFQSCTIRDNSGFISVSAGVLKLLGCSILFNQATELIFTSANTAIVTVDRCVISGNSSNTVINVFAGCTISNTLITGNNCTSYLYYPSSNNFFTNNTVTHNSVGGVDIFHIVGTGTQINNSFIGGNSNNTITGTYVNNASLISNLASFPKFISPALSYTDSPFNATDYNYHTQANSALIDSGNDTYAAIGNDLDNMPRIAGNHVDVGAYEYTITAVIDPIATNVPLKITPNPVSNTCVLDLSALENPTSLSVSDINGKVLFTQKINGDLQPKIDVSGCSSGVYLLQIVTETYTTSQKFVVAR